MGPVLITDLDNTVYDFVHVHAKSFRTLLHIVSKETGILESVLKDKCRTITRRYGSLDLQDYVFDLLLDLPEVAGRGDDFMLQLRDIVRIGFDRTRRKYLRPYQGMRETLQALDAGGVQIVALSNAPFAISYYRITQMGLRPFLSGLVAWEGALFDEDHPSRDKRLAQRQRRVRAAESAFKCVQVLARNELKPSLVGFEAIRRQFGVDTKYFAIGDSIAKDLTPAKSLNAKTVWAKYGTRLDKESLDTLLEITPWSTADVAKHVEEDVKPDYEIEKPEDLLAIVPHGAQQELF